MVITLHGGIRGVFADPRPLRRAMKRLFDATAGRFLINRAFRVIALTSSEAEHLHRKLGISESRIRVIPNAVSDESWSIHSAPQGVSGRLLVLSRLSPEKRIGDLLAALAKLRKPIGCDIAGPDAGDGENLKTVVGRLSLETVRFLGPVEGESKARLLRSALALVLPSSSEGLSMSALEAIAQGTPVIASDTAASGLPSGPCLTFPVGNVQALVTCIESLSDSNLRENLQREAQEARHGLLRIDEQARLTMQIYELALDGSRSR
jgi:glycosyltransferase involved in cell wall biosynthesis